MRAVALAKTVARGAPKGSPTPRIAPPVPARSSWRDFDSVARSLGITLMPWQQTAARYIEALGPGDRWLYPEVSVVVARQNGKTELLVPHIVKRLRAGRHIMHTAQNRELPREVFGRVADLIPRVELRARPRFANGQEEIKMRNGGTYRIVAPTRGGARGPSNDDVIIDELREMRDHSFLAAAKPTLMASANPQLLYLSNAGEEDSAVLNSVKLRADADPALAYLEWSSAPGRDASDRDGWLEANPSIGHLAALMANLEKDYRSHTLAGTLAIFETENLCRWVVTMRQRLVDDFAWIRCRADDLEVPTHPCLAVSMDPDGRRASVAIAWQRPDETIGLRLLYHVPGDPIDTRRFGNDVRATASEYGVTRTGFDPMTDVELAKYLRKPEPIGGRLFANASAQFVNAVTAGRLRWTAVDAVTEDLAFTARKPNDETGSFEAVRSADDRPITAVLAAIRAVWLASGPPAPLPKVM